MLVSSDFLDFHIPLLHHGEFNQFTHGLADVPSGRYDRSTRSVLLACWCAPWLPESWLHSSVLMPSRVSYAVSSRDVCWKGRSFRGSQGLSADDGSCATTATRPSSTERQRRSRSLTKSLRSSACGRNARAIPSLKTAPSTASYRPSPTGSPTRVVVSDSSLGSLRVGGAHTAHRHAPL